jgi:hypothetical protein
MPQNLVGKWPKITSLTFLTVKGGSTVVQFASHHYKVEGLSAATTTDTLRQNDKFLILSERTINYFHGHEL